MRLIGILCVLLPAMAAGGDDISARAEAEAAAASVSSAEATSYSGGSEASAAGGSVGDIATGSVSADQANSQSVTVEGDRHPDSIKIRNTPPAIAPDLLPTVSCFRGGSGGASGPGFGISIGAGRIDKGCVRREMIRLGHGIGLEEQAARMWCAEAVKEEEFASVEQCLGFGIERQAVVISEPAVLAVTHDEFERHNAEITAKLDELIGRIGAIDQHRREASAAVSAIREEEARRRGELEELRSQLQVDYEQVQGAVDGERAGEE